MGINPKQHKRKNTSKVRRALRTAREAQGLSLDEAATRAGYASRSAWYQVEQGRTTPSVEQMGRIAQAVGKRAVDLFEELAQVVGMGG